MMSTEPSATRPVSSPAALPEVEISVASLCAAVETTASASSDSRSLLEAFLGIQRLVALDYELERAAQWSLRGRAPREAMAEEEVAELVRLLSSTSNERQARTLTAQLQRIRHASANDRALEAPARLQITRTDEVEAETRYCAKGRPLPLRTNVLGERYASPSDPLAYLRRHRDATELFRLMRPRVKRELRLRETRRIERLNAARQHERQAAEAALEAKLDGQFERN